MPRPGLVSLLTTLLLAVPFALAQGPKPAPQQDPRNIDASAFGESIDLPSTWLFSPSDRPENASPTLDDRSWVTLSDEQAYTYDFHGVSIGWYRVHVHLPPRARNVALQLGGISDFQAFANGIQIGGMATLDRASDSFTSVPGNYRIPQSALRDSKGDLVLAIRVHSYRTFGQYSGPWPGEWARLISAAAAPRDTSYSITHLVLPLLIQVALDFLVGLVSLALYLAMRSQREYLVGAVSLFLTSALRLTDAVTVTWPMPVTVYDAASVALLAIVTVTNIEFVRSVLSRRLTRAIVATEVMVFLGTLAGMLIYATGNLFFKARLDPFILYGPLATADVLELALLISACRRRNVDALVLLPILCVSFVDDFWNLCGMICGELRPPIHLGSLPSLHVASYVFQFRDLDNLFYPVGILLFLVLRTVRIARERARIGAELEAAQSMQQLLLARSSEPTPGFDVDSVYLPASEVGGDFFLVLPDPHDGSLTAIVGDVSGKGLGAAMRVSMILGILRREDSRDPETILCRLNDALHSQGGVGFTTACCVRLRADGSFAVANAGHISPYIDGAEWETAPGLPLGLVTGQDYEERFGHLGNGGRIVLMSDGVVEARGKTGELYGFDRLAALTLQPAQEIAATAQAFGQDDDITVLTLACTA